MRDLSGTTLFLSVDLYEGLRRRVGHWKELAEAARDPLQKLKYSDLANEVQMIVTAIEIDNGYLTPA